MTDTIERAVRDLLAHVWADGQRAGRAGVGENPFSTPAAPAGVDGPVPDGQGPAMLAADVTLRGIGCGCGYGARCEQWREAVGWYDSAPMVSYDHDDKNRIAGLVFDAAGDGGSDDERIDRAAMMLPDYEGDCWAAYVAAGEQTGPYGEPFCRECGHVGGCGPADADGFVPHELPPPDDGPVPAGPRVVP